MKYLSTLLAMLICTTLTAQSVTMSSTVTAEQTVCGNSEVFTFKLKNDSTITLSSLQITIDLPTGIDYVQGSLSEVTSQNVQEVSITDNDALLFSANNLAVGDSIEFNISSDARIAAIDEQQQGTIFRNQVDVSFAEGSRSHTSDAYNILYAALNILSVSPSSQTVVTGETATRTITIVNAGNGAVSSFQLSDVRNNLGATLTGTSLGTINGTNDTITFSAIDFTSVGDGDGLFETNESITFTQEFDISGCAAQTVTSDMKAIWGCEGAEEITSSSYGHISITLKNPSLNVKATDELSSCFGSDVSQQEIRLINTGQGYATNVDIDIYKSSGSGYNENIFSRIDETSLTYQLGANGTPTSISPTAIATRNDGDWSCLGGAPIGRIQFSLPTDLAPDDTVWVRWNTYHCCISECSNQAVMGWKYEVDYQNACLTSNYSGNGTGEGTTSLNMSVFTESPSDINDGQTLEYGYTISTHDNNLPEGTGAHYQTTFTLPVGITWPGGANDLAWEVNANSWIPYYTNYNSSTREVTARFAMPLPFQLEKSELKIQLTGDCNEAGATAGSKSINLDIYYVPDSTCTSNCSVEMLCNQTVVTDLHCPVGSCEGLRNDNFTIVRTSFGEPDNDENGLADNNGTLDFSKIKTNRAMFGDTLTATFDGLVYTSGAHPSWAYGYASSNIELGANLTAFEAEVEIYDASAGTSNSCNAVMINSTPSGNDQTFDFDFSPSTLSGTCPAFSGFTFGDGDSVTLTVKYQVTGNIGGAVQEVTSTNEFYVSDVANPTSNGDKYSCDFHNGRYTLIGYYFTSAHSSNFNINSCKRTISQNFYMSIGDCCDNYQGGNLFPYEYRHWAYVKEAKLVIPDFYTIENIYFRQRRTRATNTTATQTVNPIYYSSTSGDTLLFNLEQYYSGVGGPVKFSDDGFNGTLYVTLVPSCDVADNTYEEVYWDFRFAQSDFLGGGTSDWYTGTDQVKYNPTNLSLSSTNPIVDGIGKTVTWNLQVTNTTSNTDAGNSWVHFKSPSGGMTLNHVIDDATGDTLQMTSDYFELGTVNRNSTKNYSIVASYSGCNPDYMVAYSGYECSGYPVNFTSFDCNYTTYGLHVEPKPAEMQVKVAGTTIGGECSNVIEVTLEVASVKFGHLDSITVDVTAIGGTASYTTGSAELKYPLSGSFSSVADPTENSGTYHFDLASSNSTIGENGLPGVLDLSSNRVQLRFRMDLDNTFTPGDYIQCSIGAQEICGAPVPTINLAYDPSVQFNADPTAGLSTDVGNSWGIAWGDYDGDGYEDVWVGEYAENSGSYLYHNEGDGTFSKVTSGPVVETKGSAIAATWGDYDNDGDLDLFVANNTAAENALFRNEGSGTFVQVNEEPVTSYSGYCHGATWVDYDNDGYLDLFVTDFMPTKFNLLYHNNGDGSFTQITDNDLVTEAEYAIGSTWADYDNDGDQDAFVAVHWGGENRLYRNDGAGNFTKITTGPVATDIGNSVGSSWGDIDNDGDLDLFVANTSGQGNFLYQNNGDGTFTALTSSVVVTDAYNSSGSSFIDFDNDGDLDLFVSQDQSDQSVLYANDGNGNFTRLENPLTDDFGNSYPNAWADFDNDGDMDVLVGNRSGEANVFMKNSRGSCNSYICFDLTGTNSNASAIGAKIRVKANVYGNDVWQMREISGQTGGGAGSQNMLRPLFGLGDASVVDSVIVEWPSGFTQYLTNQAVNSCNTLVEENGNLVCGTVYYDMNQNCVQDAGEEGIPGVLISVSPGGRFATTNGSGNYQLYVDDGTYTITQNIPTGWTQDCPASNGSHSVTVSGGQTDCDNDFGNVPTCDDPDLKILMGTTALRRGFQNLLTVVVQNNGGGSAENFQLNVEFDNEVIPLAADSAWSSIAYTDTTTTYTWDIVSIPPFSSYVIQIVDSVDLGATLGEEVLLKSTIGNLAADCELSDNTITQYHEIVGAVDPNDKLVSPVGNDPLSFIEETDTLQYKIRFQNIGNYYASNVIIVDTLSQYLDLSTFEVGAMSHDFAWSLEDGIVRWEIYGIVLPDSATDELGSQGYVQFSIRPKTGLAHGTVIRNDAAITFDYNDPLITNEVYNLVLNAGELITMATQLQLAPNPAQTSTSARIMSVTDDEQLPIGIRWLEVRSITGEIIARLDGQRLYELEIITSTYAPGIYQVIVYDEFGFFHEEKLIITP